MGESLDHGSKEHKHIFLLERFFPTREICLEVGDTLFHLNIPFFVRVDLTSLFLKNIATPILDDIRMRIMLDL